MMNKNNELNTQSITPLPDANFTPTLGNYKTLQPFRYWCQKVLPLVYDDSLSYYELLCKVVDYLNKTMEDVETLHGDVTNLHNAYTMLQNYVNTYFSSLDVQQEINNKLDTMANNGELSNLISPLLPQIITQWLSENITTTSPIIDKSLTISDAGADSKITGSNFDITNDLIKTFSNYFFENINEFDKALLSKQGFYNLEGKFISDTSESDKWLSSEILQINFGYIYINTIAVSPASIITFYTDDEKMISSYTPIPGSSTYNRANYIADIPENARKYSVTIASSYPYKILLCDNVKEISKMNINSVKENVPCKFNKIGWVNSETSVNSDAINWTHTDGIKVNEGEIYEITYKIFDIAYLVYVVQSSDKNGNPIQGLTIRDDSGSGKLANRIFKIPSGVNYITISQENSNKDFFTLNKLKIENTINGLAFGDSITRGYKNNDISYVNLILGRKLENYYNYAISGSHPESMSTTQLNNFKNDNIDKEKISFITLASGTNDYNAGSLVGSLDDCINRYESTIITFINEFPTTPIICILPMQRNGDNVVGVGQNTAGYTLKEYNDRLRKLCEKYSIECVDLYSELSINVNNISNYTYDGIHPNTKGQNLIADLVYQSIKKHVNL